MATQKIRVLRTFMVQGARHDPGEVLDVSLALASELIGYNKAERVIAQPPAPEAPAAPEAEAPATDDIFDGKPARKAPAAKSNEKEAKQ